MKTTLSFFVLLSFLLALGLLTVVIMDHPEVSGKAGNEESALIGTLTRACQIRIQAGETFDTSNFQTVFANDSRFTVRLSDYPLLAKYFPDPSAITAGYLDYQLAYYKWWQDGVLRLEKIQEDMKRDGRETMTEDEIVSLQEFGIAPPV